MENKENNMSEEKKKKVIVIEENIDESSQENQANGDWNGSCSVSLLRWRQHYAKLDGAISKKQNKCLWRRLQ